MEFLIYLEKQQLGIKHETVVPFFLSWKISTLQKETFKTVDCQNESCLHIFNSIPLYLCIMKGEFILSHSHGLFL